MSETAHQPRAYRFPEKYVARSVLVSLCASVIMAIVGVLGASRSEFSTEQVQVFLFAGLIEMAFSRPGETPLSIIRRDTRKLFASFAVLLVCAIAAILAIAAVGLPKPLFHFTFPIVFSCLVLFFGNQLITIRGRKIVHTVMPTWARVLVVVFVAVIFLGAFFGLASLFNWMDVVASGSGLEAIFLRACGQFLLFFPFALYALILREAFVLDGDAVPIMPNA